MRLNKEELFVGFVLTILASIFPLSIALGFLCAFLWAWSGAGANKLWRRLAVPLIWSASFWNVMALFLVPISFGFLTLGYGLPPFFDKGSWLGKRVWRLTDGNEFWSNVITRGVVYGGAVSPYLLFKVFS